MGWRKGYNSDYPLSFWGLLSIRYWLRPSLHIISFTLKISQGMQLGLRAEKLLRVPWGVVELGCMLQSPRLTFSLPWWPPKFSVNNKQISISFTHYMPNYTSLHCVWLLQSCHRMREQQLESHVRKISYGSLPINALLPKTWFYKGTEQYMALKAVSNLCKKRFYNVTAVLEATCSLVHRGTQREGSGKQSLYSDKNLLRHSYNVFIAAMSQYVMV